MNYLEAVVEQINLALDNNKSNILIGENINTGSYKTHIPRVGGNVTRPLAILIDAENRLLFGNDTDDKVYTYNIWSNLFNMGGYTGTAGTNGSAGTPNTGGGAGSPRGNQSSISGKAGGSGVAGEWSAADRLLGCMDFLVSPDARGGWQSHGLWQVESQTSHRGAWACDL
jgi:hypothetical protein